MKKLTAIALLTASGAFAFDQYLPVAPNKLETDLEFNYISLSGSYDNGGSKVSSTGSPAVYAPALQFKYGIIPGLDAEVFAEYDIMNKDAGDVNGLARPELALKYVHPDLGIGGFLNVALPVGSKSINANGSDKIPTQITGGAIYGKSFNQIAVNAYADYQYNTEDGFKYKQDAMEVYAQGQFNVTPQVGPYLGVEYMKTLNGEVDGTSDSPSDAGYLVGLQPGVKFTVNDQLAVEVAVPLTVMGENASDYWSIYAGVYYTLGL